MLTSILAITQQLNFTASEAARVGALLTNAEITPGRYEVGDVMEACREAEGAWQTVVRPDELATFVAARRLLPFQIARVQDVLSGYLSWRGEYALVDVVEACLIVEAEDVGWAA
jgi:hypothetical protein